MTQVKVLRAILRKRGYLVLYQRPDHPPFYVGRLVDRCGGEGFNLGLMEVRERTTLKDFREQQMLSKKLEPKHWEHCSPTMSVQLARKAQAKFWRVTRTRRKKAFGQTQKETGDTNET